MVAYKKTISWLCISLFSTAGFGQDTNSNNGTTRVLKSPASTKNSSIDASTPRNYSVSHAEEHSQNETPQVVSEPFTPIEATGFTDPNYQINLIKSQEQQQKLDAAPLNSITPTLTKDEQLQQYVNARNQYVVGSYEYNVIQGKIDKLLAND